MKLFIYILTFFIFASAIVIGGEYFYDQKYAQNQDSAQQDTQTNTNTQTNKESQTKTDAANIIEKAPPHFLAGFDWRLPEGTQITNNSGLISFNNDDPEIVRNRFIIVKWDESNPAKRRYDFSKLEADLKAIAPQKSVIRLEVNSSCEAPNWALGQLRETKHKSLIYWDKNYQELTKPYIEAFAKRFASHPQIIGVQLGLGDGEFGDTPNSCKDYDNKNGWGEFWMSPSEREEAETQFGFNPDVFTQATIANIDIYADAFGAYKNKLAFTNIGTLYTYGEGAKPYNENLKTIAKYALDKGLGNRDGAVERWMSYTDKIYGSVFTTMPDGSCRLDVDEQYMRKLKGRYWGTENEFYGNKDYVINEMGPVENHPYIFMISSLRALQMRRNAFSVTNMREFDHPDYKTQAFMKYLIYTLGKQYEDTPDAFVLMGERYIVPYRLADQMDVACVSNNKHSVAVRSFGRWLTESPENTQVENKAAIKVTMPANENYWYQGFYLPEGIDYEYFAREAKTFTFDLNDKLSQFRCKNGCEVEVKATFKDTVKTNLHIEVAEGITQSIQTLGDTKIKTANFTVKSNFNNQLNKSDLRLVSENHSVPLILMRINFK